MSYLKSQDKPHVNFPMIGETAPAFTAESTKGTINFPDDYTLQWKILFSHPADFTPVCTSELLELAALQDDMKALKTKLVVVSVDRLETHYQWIKSMEQLKYKGRAPAKIEFPLVSDLSLDISKSYAMIPEKSRNPRDVRSVFIVDPQNIVRAIFIYPMNVGRNMDELKRTLIALQTADKQEVLMPANWQPGDDVLLPFRQNGASQDATALNDPQYYQVAWYMNFKKTK